MVLAPKNTAAAVLVKEGHKRDHVTFKVEEVSIASTKPIGHLRVTVDDKQFGTFKVEEVSIASTKPIGHLRVTVDDKQFGKHTETMKNKPEMSLAYLFSLYCTVLCTICCCMIVEYGAKLCNF
ncbi:hypothetical protein QE152_g4123 [Popillia japonica]|uniref:Uncharacterized protein n=1 Tax=Popillia japonica TaxID=7064 RepID=A0AAW1N0B3_POPJA